MPEDISEDMPDRMPDRMPEDMSEYMPEDMPDRMPDRMPEDMSDRMPEDMPDRMPEDLPDRMPEDMPEDMPDRMPNRMSEDMSDRMPEDVPVRTCINVMVGITRSKVTFFFHRSCRRETVFCMAVLPFRSLFTLHVLSFSVFFNLGTFPTVSHVSSLAWNSQRKTGRRNKKDNKRYKSDSSMNATASLLLSSTAGHSDSSIF